MTILGSTNVVSKEQYVCVTDDLLIQPICKHMVISETNEQQGKPGPNGTLFTGSYKTTLEALGPPSEPRPFQAPFTLHPITYT